MRILTTCPEAAAVATAFGIATLLPIAGIHPALAQQQSPVLTNVVPQAESITVRAKIASIDPQSREVTLVGRSGKPVTMHAGDEVRNLDKLKAGDIVDAEYKRSVAFELSGPNEKAPADEMTKVVARADQGLEVSASARHGSADWSRALIRLRTLWRSSIPQAVRSILSS